MEAVKSGINWLVKAWLAIVVLMIAGLFVGGVLSDPIGSTTGGCVTSTQCTDDH